MAYKDFIPENVAPLGTRRIGIYDSNGNRVGQIPLESLTPPNPAHKLYSFGALSDAHIGRETSETDLQTALTYLSDTEQVAFICICGDLSEDGSDNLLLQYKTIVSNRSVYAIAGNHEGITANVETRIATYTGKPLYYSVSHGNDVFIMVGTIGGEMYSDGVVFASGELQWLYETLEANRNKRCFVFQHIFAGVENEAVCGNAGGLYTNWCWHNTAECKVFESLMKHYKNVTWFHGHSHLRYSLQQYGQLYANYSDGDGYRSVHIPSLAVPRGDTDNDGTLDTIYEGSEGYVVDVYENGIHLRGRDFVKGEFLPIASYWLDTTLKTVEANTYKDSTGTICTGYTNMVSISTESDGVTIYNGGKGYKDGYRIRSGGAEASAVSGTITGFIPVTAGDIVRVSGCVFTASTNANAINCADSSFANIGQAVANYANGGYGIFTDEKYQNYRFNSVVEETTGVYKWIVPPSDSGVAYIRITARTAISDNHAADGADLIVTVNEEIT